MSLPLAARPVAAYLVLAFGLAWLIWLPVVLSADGLNLFHTSFSMDWIALGTVGPIAAALLVSRRETGRWLPSRLFPPASPARLLNLFTAPLLILLAVDLVPYLISTQPGSRHPHWSDLAPLLIWMNVLGGPLGEEFGWRGFLLPRLTSRFGPTPATLLLGFIWTAWHLPLFLLHTWSSAPLWFFTILTVSVAFFLTLGYNLTGGSILAGILAHYTFNSTASIYANLLANATPRPSLDPFVTLAIAFPAAALLLIAATKGRLGRSAD
jgi:uncharacterized protein